MAASWRKPVPSSATRRTVTQSDVPAVDGATEPVGQTIDEVRQLVVEGREQGYLSGDRIAEALRDVELTARSDRQHLPALRRPRHRHRRRRRGRPWRNARRRRARRRLPPLDLSITDDQHRPGPHVPQADRQGGAAHRRTGSLAGQAHRASRHGGQAPADRGQPAPRRLDRQTLRRPRPAVARPDPGGQPRPHARRREVRLPARLQVLDLRHLVDPPGDHPGGGRPGPHHPRAGAHGRADQPPDPRAAPAAPGPRPRAHRRRDRRRDGHRRAQRCARS